MSFSFFHAKYNSNDLFIPNFYTNLQIYFEHFSNEREFPTFLSTVWANFWEVICKLLQRVLFDSNAANYVWLMYKIKHSLLNLNFECLDVGFLEVKDWQCSRRVENDFYGEEKQKLLIVWACEIFYMAYWQFLY